MQRRWGIETLGDVILSLVLCYYLIIVDPVDQYYKYEHFFFGIVILGSVILYTFVYVSLLAKGFFQDTIAAVESVRGLIRMMPLFVIIYVFYSII